MLGGSGGGGGGLGCKRSHASSVNVSHTTASWGGQRTFFYTSTSAEADDITFDHDITWTQSQSNAGNQDSRPQAWAKNVFSVGGIHHANNGHPSDDSWQNGGASIGPASDGRIKPTMCAYYDSIGTSDLTGSAGYSAANWTAGFSGTSGATPIVAGHNVLAGHPMSWPLEHADRFQLGVARPQVERRE